MECNSCVLTTAMNKAVRLSDKPMSVISDIVLTFVQGHKTFKETCAELGLNEEQMRSVLDEKYWNSTMN